jgi:hypothetical protein
LRIGLPPGLDACEAGAMADASKPQPDADDPIADLIADGTTMAVDTDGDGYAETLLIDANSNGVIDAVVVEQADGSRIAMADIDEDGEFDLVMDPATGQTITVDEYEEMERRGSD